MPYSERYVAFIDILGFSDIVKRSETDSKLFDALVKTLSDIQAHELIPGADAEDVQFQFQTFSDSIVLSSTRTMNGLGYMLSSIQRLAINLLQEQHLIRGGIARGKLYHEKGVMFGPAFMEAYRIERTFAKYPRIILNKETYEDYKNYKATQKFRFDVRPSEDGPPYLFIFQIIEFLLSKSDTRVGGMERATTCRQAIQTLLNESIHIPKSLRKTALARVAMERDHR